jgi:hypothetical protein
MAESAELVGWQLSREFTSDEYRVRSDVDSSSYELVFGPRRVAELQANGSCGIGRQAKSEGTV